jgi:hypothetical protein
MAKKTPCSAVVDARLEVWRDTWQSVRESEGGRVMCETEQPVLSYRVKMGLLFIGWFVIFIVAASLQHGGDLSAKIGGGITTGLFGVLFVGEMALAISEVRRRERGGPSLRQQRRKAERSSRKLPAASSSTPGWGYGGADLMADTGYRGTPFIVRVFALAGIWFVVVMGLEPLVRHGFLSEAYAGVIAVLLVVLFLFALLLWSVMVSDHRQRDGIKASAGRAKAYFTPGKEAVPVYYPQVIAPSYPVAAGAAQPQPSQFAPPPAIEAPQIAPPPVVVVPLAPLRPLPVREAPLRVDLGDAERVNEILAEVEGFPGMDHVIEQIRGDTARAMVDATRREHNEPTAQRGLHSLFLGPPGTGKTMVADLCARIFCAAGLLPTDKIVRVGGSDLLGKYIGHTAGTVQDLVDKAQGGVLFIDEAYALTPRGQVEFSSEATIELMRLMEDPDKNFIVVAAGYETEMDAWLGSNPGLAERFGRTLTFDAYDGPTLARIAEVIATKDGVTLDAAGAAMLATHLTRMSLAPPPTWANARSVRQILDKIYTAQAIRLASCGLISDAAARRAITVDDVAAVVARERDSVRR